MRRSSDLVVMSSDMRASCNSTSGTHINTPHEPALKGNMVSDGQTSWLNRGGIETGLFAVFFPLLKCPIIGSRPGQCLRLEPLHQPVCPNTSLDYDYSITLREQRAGCHWHLRVTRCTHVTKGGRCSCSWFPLRSQQVKGKLEA